MSDKMTVAQALRKIKNIKGQLAEAQERARLAVSYETTKVPAFRYKDSVDAMFSLQDEMIALEARVAIANARSTVQYDGGDFSMCLAIRTLQELKGRIAFLRGLSLKNETVKDRTTDWDDEQCKNITHVTETVFVSDLSEQDRDQQVKALQAKFEGLNNVVENANHTVLI